MIIALPVYNEEQILRENTLKILDFVKKNLGGEKIKIVIADNCSNDKTREIGESLAKNYQEIEYLFFKILGKGIAIREAWNRNKNKDNIFVFMDIDLSTDLGALPLLVKSIKKDGYDIAIGSRLVRGAMVERSVLRKITSRGLSFLLRGLLGLKVEDTPCGFKAVNQKVVDRVLPKVKNNEWFFDTELLILAEREGYKIKEVPVKWREVGEGLKVGQKRESKIKIFGVIKNYLKEILRMA